MYICYDRDMHSCMIVSYRVEYPSKAGQLDADSHQKLSMTFHIKSMDTAASITAHQVSLYELACQYIWLELFFLVTVIVFV